MEEIEGQGERACARERGGAGVGESESRDESVIQIRDCHTLQHTAMHCNTLQHTATHTDESVMEIRDCHTLQHTATHGNTRQHTDKSVIQTRICARESKCEQQKDNQSLISDRTHL